jgi:hypothetical protein
MKTCALLFCAAFLVVWLVTTAAVHAESVAGEYADKHYLDGSAVFQMSIEGSGNGTQVWFSAVKNDGQGAAPEGQGVGKFAGKDTVQFKFNDSCNNSGSGTITRSGDDIIVSMKPAHVADSRCVMFYGQNMRLKRVKK